MAADSFVFRCIEVQQPIGMFYVGAMDSADLQAISYADMRRITEGTPRDVEEFSGIQRPLNGKRVTELQQYVGTVDAAFPTSIILHIESEHVEYDPAKAAMQIKRAPNIAKIIDGQHRIAGLSVYRGPTFELNVTIFIDMDMEDQALLFATINLKQTRVSKSLAYDLYEFARTRSPQKTCHNIAKLLNSREESPFYHRIKILGRATQGREETLTQAAFVDRLMPLISDDPMRDRDALKRGKKLPPPSAEKADDLVFRLLFSQERDAELAKNIWNFFAAVQKRWPRAWGQVEPGLILNRTTGFVALMRFLAASYRRECPGRDKVLPEPTYLETLAGIGLDDAEFTRERYLPGTSGQAQLFRDLVKHAGY